MKEKKEKRESKVNLSSDGNTGVYTTACACAASLTTVAYGVNKVRCSLLSGGVLRNVHVNDQHIHTLAAAAVPTKLSMG